MFRLRNFIVAVLVIVAANTAADAQNTARIKDISDVEGVRTNKLTGMGLISGLDGTGGKTPVTRQFAQNFLQRYGNRADPEQRMSIINDTRQKTDNLAVVMVTAEVPAFARPGGRIDVMVSAFDDASSLQGGVLMGTALLGVDGKVYGMASGPISIGGFSFGGAAAGVQKNHPNVGRVPGGLTLEEPIEMHVGHGGRARLILRHPDFSTANRISTAINTAYPLTAHARDPGTIDLVVPGDQLADVNGFFAKIGDIRVRPDAQAMVVINERTGTIIVGTNVRLARVAITHANLSIITTESPEVSQPAPFAGGATTVVPRTQVEVVEERNSLMVVDNTASVGDLAQALNALGVSPRDLSAIFQQLKAAGALHARLEFR